MRTERIESPNLANDVVRLQARLTALEASRVNPVDSEIAAIRVELQERQATLVAVEQAEADEQCRKQSQTLLRVAESEVENIKTEIIRLRTQFAALPAQIQNAELRFHRALKISADAKSAVARLEDTN
jgi:hypothetical protein